MDATSIPAYLRSLLVKPLIWKLCDAPDLGELVLLDDWEDDGSTWAVYADFFEPRVFYRSTPYWDIMPVEEKDAVSWERAEMDRPTL